MYKLYQRKIETWSLDAEDCSYRGRGETAFDVMNKLPRTIDNLVFLLTVVDQFSRYEFAFPFSHASTVPRTIIHHITIIHRTDNDTEFFTEVSSTSVDRGHSSRAEYWIDVIWECVDREILSDLKCYFPLVFSLCSNPTTFLAFLGIIGMPSLE